MQRSFKRFGALAIIAVTVGGGCSASHVNCQTVKLQREANRSDSEIASALGASEAEIAKCAGGGAAAAAPESASGGSSVTPDSSGGGGGGGSKPAM